MTDHTLEKRAGDIEKLFQDIPKEPWEFREVNHGGYSDIGLYAGKEQIVNLGNNERYYPLCGEIPDDEIKTFIEKAPEMANLVRELWERVERLNEKCAIFKNALRAPEAATEAEVYAGIAALEKTALLTTYGNGMPAFNNPRECVCAVLEAVAKMRRE